MSTNYFKQEIVTPDAAITNGAHKRRTLESVVYSYDQNVSKLIIPIATPKSLELDFEDVETIKILLTVIQDNQIKKIEDTATIEDGSKRNITYILTDCLKGYAGKVVMNVYLDLKNGQQIDLAEYGFTMVRSAIDQDMPEIEDFYFKSLDDVITELKQKTEAAWQEVAGDLSEINGSIDAVNEKVNQLDSKADEISDQIANNDFRNFIIGKEIAIDSIANFVSKINASVAENPHSAYFSQAADVPLPPVNTGEISTTNYTGIALSDGKLISPSVNASTRRMSLVAKFDVVSDIDRNNPGLFDFFRAITPSEKITLARKLVDGTIRPVAYASGSGASTTSPGTSRSQINMQIYGTTWHGGAVNTTSKIAMLEYKNQTGQRIQDDGCVYVVLYAPPSDDVAPSVINIDQVYLEYKIKFKMSDVYAVKSSAQMNKVTQDNGDALIKVSDTETILDRVIASGAGLKNGEGTGKTADSPNTNNVRLFINMVVASAGSVIAVDSQGNLFTRSVSGSVWRGEWQEYVSKKVFDDLVKRVIDLEGKVK